MGINPIMSMLEHLHLESHLRAGGGIRALKLLYGTRAKQGEAILFYERIARILGEYMSGVPGVALGKDVGYGAYIYATFCSQWNPKKVPMYEKLETDHLKHNKGHIRLRDALDALGPRVDRKNTVAYICGPPKMTDVFVERLSTAEGMDPKRVLCEKWW